ncbi:hypothetical protein [Methylibium sp.]|uniref:hypothetical protein n=1 Tax=Methylibium sp. TaxID=2067992 RepID=UPI0017D56B29|nr:hypothetical protein [Methylibium sp.]MBA3591531.1 hypothetical protein [Methylibium sp.]
MRSTALARQMEAVFERDARDCVELEHATWIKRGAWHRFKDQTLYLFSQQL